MKRFLVFAYVATCVLGGCGNITTQSPHGPSRMPSVVHIDAEPAAPHDPNDEYRLQLTDGRSRAFDNSVRVRSDGTYVSFSGRGYQMSYPVRSISQLTRVSKGARQPLNVIQPICIEDSGTCCDAWVGCYGNSDPGSAPSDTVTIDFRLYGGSEVCSWSPSTDWLDCSVGGFQRPNLGDGYKGNVIKSFTYSVSRQDAEVACNPASYTDKTKGTIEYSEFRPGQLPELGVHPTGELDPNTETHMHFHPALSSASQVAGVFLFVYPAIGLAATCNKSPADMIP